MIVCGERSSEISEQSEVNSISEKYYLRIGENVACYRKKKHLTQEGLALKANISRTHISHIEAKNVQKAPSLEILFRICEIRGIEPYQLFLEPPEEPSKSH